TGLALGMARPVLSLALIAIWVGWPLMLLASGWPGLLPVVGVGVPFAASAWCLERGLPHAAAHPHDPPSAHPPARHPTHAPEPTACPPPRSPVAPPPPPPPSSRRPQHRPPAAAATAARTPPS